LPWSGLSTKWQVADGLILYGLNYVSFIAGVWFLGKETWQGLKTAAVNFFWRSKADVSKSQRSQRKELDESS